MKHHLRFTATLMSYIYQRNEVSPCREEKRDTAINNPSYLFVRLFPKRLPSPIWAKWSSALSSWDSTFNRFPSSLRFRSEATFSTSVPAAVLRLDDFLHQSFLLKSAEIPLNFKIRFLIATHWCGCTRHSTISIYSKQLLRWLMLRPLLISSFSFMKWIHFLRMLSSQPKRRR